MHCTACDKLLSDFETTRKIVSEEGRITYPDLCNSCFSSSRVGDIAVVIEREDLYHDEDILDDFDSIGEFEEE